ncbi:MAG TPA: DUF3313 domain-containing protein [Candidatus Binataceae bacterium]|nr:DUF3313 domain-containing protein [Candidatus Binataceae bacterium]
MNTKRSLMRLATGLASATLAGFLLAACSQTTGQDPNIIQRAQGETPAAPAPSGFLGSDYSLLQPGAPGSGQEAQLAYTNTSANFTSYSKVMIAPVTFWGDSDSNVSSADQQKLCDYFYNVLQQDLSKNFTVVNEPGEGVAKLTVALTDATSAIPVLRTISVIVPQAHALNLIKMGLTGTYAFVGSATGEAKLTDSVTGQLLAAWADKRFGTAAVRNATVWQWGDADNAMSYWANALDQRLVTLGVQHTATTAAAN